MKKLIGAAIAAFLSLSGVAHAQPISDFRSYPLATLYDLDSTSLIYCRTSGASNIVFQDNRITRVPITAAANSTTVTSTGGAFTNLVVGDHLFLVDPSPLTLGRVVERVITARASANSITISSAVSTSTAVSQQSFEWRKLECGTAATSGWVPVEALRPVKFSIAVNQLSVATGGVDIRVECREQGEDAQPFRVYPTTGFTNYTAAGIDSRLVVGLSIYDLWKECRVGVKLSGTDDGGDTGANAEQITIRAVFAR